jgi:UDPglucose--hexose-1-phosphate uridylyltransferase
MSFDPAEHPHRRYNPLRDEWILVSPHRAKRPWQGQEDAPELDKTDTYDAGCYLCPGNQRVTGEINPKYPQTFVFNNDFSALLDDTPAPTNGDPLFRAETARGTARVMCFSPDHSRSLAEFSAVEIRPVVDCWCEQVAELGQSYKHVQVFETKGELLGSSSPHPHGQIWASDYLPQEVATEERTQAQWLDQHGAPMLLQLAEKESGGPRAVVENADWLAVVPWWADWPFETLLLPKFVVRRLPDLTDTQRDSLSEAIRELTARYDNLFQCAFPYLMGWHGAPFNGEANDHWQLHAHYYPPLLRSASVRKFKAGYEALAEAQRDLTAEQAAARLRAVSAVHYREHI